MPCDDGSRSDCYDPALQRKVSDLEADMRRLHDRLDRYAQMLCEQCKVMDKLRLTEVYTKEVRGWWEAHKIIDANREAKEAAEAKAARDKRMIEYNKLKAELGL